MRVRSECMYGKYIKEGFVAQEEEEEEEEEEEATAYCNELHTEGGPLH
eukprot:COSAG06_NODE_1887_length_8141_cov_11.312609_5_plen_48_part_00